MSSNDLKGDCAIFAMHRTGEIVQSIDVISELVPDPFILGRIAAGPVLSDIYAANAWYCVSAMACITLAFAR